jgi:hypothetical protein
MDYSFLVDTYSSERLKTLNVWSTRLAFIRRYADDSEQRLAHLETQDGAWWMREVAFFDTLHGVYGLSVDTGGLPINGAVTIYAYPDIPSLIAGESRGGSKAPLPGPGQRPSTERPDR